MAINQAVIYALCEPGTSILRYVGKTTDPTKRLKGHLKDSVKKTSHLGRWLKSLNGQRPELVILSTVPEEDWQSEEKRQIARAREQGFDLVNATDGGEGCHNPSEETRKKMAAWPRPHWVRSAELRARLSAASKGRPRPAFSEEWKRNISLGLKGRKCAVSQHAKLKQTFSGSGNPFFGKTHSEETRAKLRSAWEKRRLTHGNSWSGKTHSESTREKMRAAWERRKVRKEQI